MLLKIQIMITHSLNNRIKIITGFNRFSKFLVLGNNIDGFVNIKQEEFKDWADLMQRFPEMYRNLKFAGEWSLNIYQVPDDYKIKYQYGYFMVPKKGKMIADIGYMQVAGKKLDVFISNGMLHFNSRSADTTNNYYKGIEDLKGTIIYEEFLTIILREEIDNVCFKDEYYPGNADAIHHEMYTQVY